MAANRSEEHTSELQSRQYLHSFPTRRSSDLHPRGPGAGVAAHHPGRHTGAAGPLVPGAGPRRAAHRVRPDRGRSGLRRRRHADDGPQGRRRLRHRWRQTDRKSTRLNSSHANIYTLSLHDALPIFILAVQELGSLPITLAGTPEQQARWFPALARGEQLIAFALTEAEAGSDAAATRTTARKDGDGYVIDGGKQIGRAHV